MLKLLLNELPVNNTTSNNLIMKSALSLQACQNTSKTLEDILNKSKFFRAVIFRTSPDLRRAVPLKMKTVDNPPNEKGKLPKTVPRRVCICILFTCHGVCSYKYCNLWSATLYC